jgi:hypothetical protein
MWGLETKNNCAGEGQQQFTLPEPEIKMVLGRHRCNVNMILKCIVER